MKVILNKKQITHISKLIEKKGVNYYDVNLEMTDHVASEVEEMMFVDGIDFLIALKQVFSRYGRFHFMKIEEEQTKKIQKQSLKQSWKSFVQFFTLPKILITVALFIFFQFLLENGFGDYILYTYALFVGITSISLFYLKRKWIGKENYLQLHKFHGGFSVLFQFIFQGMIHFPKADIGTGFMFDASFITFSFMVLFIVIEV